MHSSAQSALAPAWHARDKSWHGFLNTLVAPCERRTFISTPCPGAYCTQVAVRLRPTSPPVRNTAVAQCKGHTLRSRCRPDTPPVHPARPMIAPRSDRCKEFISPDPLPFAAEAPISVFGGCCPSRKQQVTTPAALSISKGAGSVRIVVRLPGAHLYIQVLRSSFTSTVAYGPATLFSADFAPQGHNRPPRAAARPIRAPAAQSHQRRASLVASGPGARSAGPRCAHLPPA